MKQGFFPDSIEWPIRTPDQGPLDPSYRIPFLDDEREAWAALLSSSPKPDEELARLQSAKFYSRYHGVPFAMAYEYLDEFHKDFIGTPLAPKTDLEAIYDSAKAAALTMEMGKLARQWMLEGGKDGELRDRIKEYEKQIEKLADTAERSWYVKLAKLGAEAIPYIASGATKALVMGGAAALLMGAPPLGATAATAAAVAGMSELGAALDVADISTGLQYYKMREEGFSPSVAGAASAISGAIQGVIETKLGLLSEALGTAVTAPVRNAINRRIGAKLLLHPTIGALARGVVSAVETGVEEGAEEAFQELTSQVTTLIAREFEESAKLPPAQSGIAAHEIWEAAKAGFLSSIVLSPFFAGPKVFRDVSELSRARNIVMSSPRTEAIAKLSELGSFQNLPEEERRRVAGQYYDEIRGAQKVLEGPPQALPEQKSPEVLPQRGVDALQEEYSKVLSEWESNPLDLKKYDRLQEISSEILEASVESLETGVVEAPLEGEEWERWRASLEPEQVEPVLPEEVALTVEQKAIGRLLYPEPELRSKVVQEFREKISEFTSSPEETDSVLFVVNKLVNTVPGLDLETFLVEAFHPGFSYKTELPTHTAGATLQAEVAGLTKSLMAFSEKANASSFIHEASHAYINFLQTHKDIPQIQQALAEIETALGVEDGNWEAEATQWTSEVPDKRYYEVFAEELQQYIVENKTKIPELRAVFDRIVQWLKDLYRAISQVVTVTPQIREFFDKVFQQERSIDLQAVKEVREAFERKNLAAAKALHDSVDRGLFAPGPSDVRVVGLQQASDVGYAMFRVDPAVEGKLLVPGTDVVVPLNAWLEGSGWNVFREPSSPDAVLSPDGYRRGDNVVWAEVQTSGPLESPRAIRIIRVLPPIEEEAYRLTPDLPRETSPDLRIFGFSGRGTPIQAPPAGDTRILIDNYPGARKSPPKGPISRILYQYAEVRRARIEGRGETPVPVGAGEKDAFVGVRRLLYVSTRILSDLVDPSVPWHTPKEGASLIDYAHQFYLPDGQEELRKTFSGDSPPGWVEDKEFWFETKALLDRLKSISDESPERVLRPIGNAMLSTNSKTERSLNFDLTTCIPTERCDVCYAKATYGDIGVAAKARLRYTIATELYPKEVGIAIASYVRSEPKEKLPFLRVNGSGDLSFTWQAEAINTVIERLDRPLVIFSRAHFARAPGRASLADISNGWYDPDNPANGCVVYKMGSVDPQLIQEYGVEFLREDLSKRGILPSYLYADPKDAEYVKMLRDAGVPLILHVEPTAEVIQSLYDNDLLATSSSDLSKAVLTCNCSIGTGARFKGCVSCMTVGNGCFAISHEMFVTPDGRHYHINDLMAGDLPEPSAKLVPKNLIGIPEHERLERRTISDTFRMAAQNIKAAASKAVRRHRQGESKSIRLTVRDPLTAEVESTVEGTPEQILSAVEAVALQWHTMAESIKRATGEEYEKAKAEFYTKVDGIRSGDLAVKRYLKGPGVLYQDVRMQRLIEEDIQQGKWVPDSVLARYDSPIIRGEREIRVALREEAAQYETLREYLASVVDEITTPEDANYYRMIYSTRSMPSTLKEIDAETVVGALDPDQLTEILGEELSEKAGKEIKEGELTKETRQEIENALQGKEQQVLVMLGEEAPEPSVSIPDSPKSEEGVTLRQAEQEARTLRAIIEVFSTVTPKDEDIETILDRKKALRDSVESARKEAEMLVRLKILPVREALESARKEAEMLASQAKAPLREALQSAREESKLSTATLEAIARERERVLREAINSARKEASKLKAYALKEYRDRVRTKALIRKYIHIIMRKPSRAMSAEFQERLLEFQSQFVRAFSSAQKATRQKLAEALGQLTGESLERAKRELSVRELASERVEVLKALAEQATEIRKQGREARKRFLMERKKQFLSDQEKILSVLKTEEIRGRTSLEGRKKSDTSLWKKAYLRALTPERIMEMLQGGVEGPFTELFVGLVNRATDEALRKQGERKGEVERILKESGLPVSYWGEVLEANGLSYTRQEVMGIYIQMMNEDSRAAVLYGDNISEEDAEALISKLSPKDKEIAEKVQEITAREVGRLKEAIARNRNELMVEVERYFPMLRQNRAGSGSIEAAIQEDILERHGVRPGVRSGWSKRRTQIRPENQRPIRHDLFNVASHAIEAQEQYIAMQETISRLSRLVRDTMVQKALISTHGYDVIPYLTKYLTDISRAGFYSDPMTRVSRVIRSNVTVAKLAFNLVSMAKQLPSILFYLPEAGPVYMLKSVAEFIGDPAGVIKKVHELDPQVRARIISRELEEFKRLNAPGYEAVVRKIGHVGMRGLALVDQLAVVIGWNAVFLKTLDETGNADKAAKHAQLVTVKTQPSARPQNLPEIYRSGEIANWMLLFSNQMNKIFNMIAWDIPLAMREKHFGMALGYVVAIALSGVAMGVLSRKRFPEDSEEAAKDILYQVLSAIPLVGPSLVQGLKGWDPTGTEFIEVANDIGRTFSALSGDTLSWEEKRNKVIATLSRALALAGIPDVQARRVYKTFIDDYGELRVDFWELLGGVK